MASKQNKTDCVFCKIVTGEIPSKIIYRDEDVVVFPDIAPAAPVHLLVIPVKHVASLAAMTDADIPLIGKMVFTLSRVAKEQGLDAKGYRLVVNCGVAAGQVVPHLHIHLLGGRPLSTMG
jgi:histidine triad (HIT) family protein